MPHPNVVDIAAAAERLRPHAFKTPLLEWAVVNEATGGRILAKAETMQRTGSFKFRGAYNRISQINRDEHPGGVVACSSGNHAQGVAEAARLCGLPSVIVMPSDAPKIKIARTKHNGAEVVLYNRDTEDRDAIAAELCKKLNAVFVSPFDDAGVIAGQGTVGLELAEQARHLGASIDAVLTPASGGGLVAGVGLAVKSRFPSAEVYCVEPEEFDDYKRSLESGVRQKNPRANGSICDSLLIGEPGKLTFEINKRQLAGGITVSDEQVRRAMAFAYRELKLVVEPGGCAALAAVLSGNFPARDRTVAVVLSGGNVDPSLFGSVISENFD